MGGKSSKAAKPKLTYYDARGRGELCRLVMAAAKKDLEDVRLSQEEWSEMKPKSFFGTLPTLEIDGKEHFQGCAIATYLAREHGFYGANNLENLMIDQMVQMKEEVLQQEMLAAFGTEESKAEAMKKLTEEVYPRIMKIYSKFIDDNQEEEESDYAVGEKLSLADLAIYEATEMCSKNSPDFLDGFPAIKDLRAKVAAENGVKEYLAKRKDTPL